MDKTIKPTDAQLNLLVLECTIMYAKLTSARPRSGRHRVSSVRHTSAERIVAMLLVVDLNTSEFRIAATTDWLGEHDEAQTVEISGSDCEIDVRRKLAIGVEL